MLGLVPAWLSGRTLDNMPHLLGGSRARGHLITFLRKHHLNSISLYENIFRQIFSNPKSWNSGGPLTYLRQVFLHFIIVSPHQTVQQVSSLNNNCKICQNTTPGKVMNFWEKVDICVFFTHLILVKLKPKYETKS